MISSKENDMKEEIYQGYKQLAFGSIADAIKLLFMEEPAPRALGKMNFINVAEIRRMKEGAMEIMGNEYTKLVVLDLITNKEIAVVTDREITTANPEIVVKLTPAYGGNK